jgi:uncharacterized protein YgfB (UPF0149 family)
MNIDAVFSEWLGERLPRAVSIPEFHGAIAGLLCAAGDRAQELEALPRDLARLLGVDAAHIHPELVDVVADAASALDAPEMPFDPWLPDDETELRERLAALADWCSAFIAGFERGEAVLDDEAEEALADLGAIADLDVDAADDDESAEVDLAALTEHVRIAVLMLREAARERSDDDG